MQNCFLVQLYQYKILKGFVKLNRNNMDITIITYNNSKHKGFLSRWIFFFFELGPKSASGSPKSTQLNEDNIYAVFYDEAFQSVLIDSLDTKSIGTFIVRIFLSAKNVYFQNFKIAFLFPPKLLHSTIIHFENSKTDKK